MAYRATVRVNVRCPNHVRFNPERDGPGAIKGGCTNCLAVQEIYQALRKAETIVRYNPALAGGKKAKEATA